MPTTGQSAPVKMELMPYMLKPPDTVASEKAAAMVATAMPVPPLRRAVTGAMSLPAGRGGVGRATAGFALMAGAVIIGLRFLRYLACRWAPVASLALGRSSVMLSVICALLPKRVKAGGAELAVADRMLNISVAQIVLQRPGIDAVVGELVASGMSEHVRVRLEGEPRLLAGPLYQAGEPGRREGRLAFRHEDEIAARYRLSLEPPERAQLIALDRVAGRHASLHAFHVKAGLVEVHLVPAPIADLICPDPIQRLVAENLPVSLPRSHL